MSVFLVSLVVFFFGFGCGYTYARHLLHVLAIDLIGARLTAKLFGYPHDSAFDRVHKRPTIAELEAILNNPDDLDVEVLPDGQCIAVKK